MILEGPISAYGGLVAVRIHNPANGKSLEVRAAIDTGATTCAITGAVAEALELPVAGVGFVTSTTHARVPARVFGPAELAIGKYRVPQMQLGECVSSDPSAWSALIGLDLICSGRLVIEGSRFTLELPQ